MSCDGLKDWQPQSSGESFFGIDASVRPKLEGVRYDATSLDIEQVFRRVHEELGRQTYAIDQRVMLNPTAAENYRRAVWPTWYERIADRLWHWPSRWLRSLPGRLKDARQAFKYGLPSECEHDEY